MIKGNWGWKVVGCGFIGATSAQDSATEKDEEQTEKEDSSHRSHRTTDNSECYSIIGTVVIVITIDNGSSTIIGVTRGTSGGGGGSRRTCVIAVAGLTTRIEGACLVGTGSICIPSSIECSGDRVFTLAIP